MRGWKPRAAFRYSLKSAGRREHAPGCPMSIAQHLPCRACLSLGIESPFRKRKLREKENPKEASSAAPFSVNAFCEAKGVV
jgi:hypothetical protein